MKRTITLAAGASKSIEMSGRYIYIERADDDIELTVTTADGTNDSDVYQERSRIVLDSKLIRLDIKNLGGSSSTITLRTGWVMYLPPINTTGSAVSVEPGDSPLDVSGSSVTVEPGANPLLAEVEPGANPLGVTEILGDTLNAPAPVVPDVTGTTIAANPARRQIVLYAPAGNGANVHIASVAGQGIPLEPGGVPVTLETTAAIPLIAANAVDSVTYIEIEV